MVWLTESGVNFVWPFLVLPVEDAGPVTRPSALGCPGITDSPCDLRNQPSIDEDAGFKLDQIDMLAVAFGKLTDVRFAPRVDRDLEGSTRLDARNETCDDGQSNGSLTMLELAIGDDLTANLEFLEGCLGIGSGWEEEDVPVVVPHDGKRAVVIMERAK